MKKQKAETRYEITATNTINGIVFEIEKIENAMREIQANPGPFAGYLSAAANLVEYYVYHLNPQLLRIRSLVGNNRELFGIEDDAFVGAHLAVEAACNLIERMANEKAAN